MPNKQKLILPCEISLILIGLMFSLPFVIMYHRLPILTFYAEWIAASLGFAACATAFGVAVRSSTKTKCKFEPIKIPQSSLIFVGLATILCLQWAIGMLHSSQYALLMLSYLTWAFLLVILGSHLRHKLGWERLANIIAWCLMIAGAINVCIVFLQLVTRTGGYIPSFMIWSGYGTLSQPNHFANFTALATVSLIYLYAKSRFSLSLFVLLLACFLCLLSFSASRSAWLYLAAFTVFAALIQANTKKKNIYTADINNIFRISLLLIPAFIIVQLLMHYMLPDDLVVLSSERIKAATDTGAPSARLQIWYDSLRLFLRSPLLGVGAGNMRAETFMLLDKPSTLGFNRVFEHGHNLFLHLLAEMGITALFILFIGLVAWVKSFKLDKFSTETWWLISLLAVLGIHSMLEYPFWYAYFLGAFAFLLGAGDDKNFIISLPKIGCKTRFTALVAVILTGMLNLTTLLIANMKLESWIHQFAENNTSNISQLDWVRQNSLLSPYADIADIISKKINTNKIEDEVLLSQAVMRFKPTPKIAYQHVLLLKLQGDDINAKKCLNLALRAYPKNDKDILELVPFEHRQLLQSLLTSARTGS